MTGLTTKELAFIEDEIRAEEITGKALNWCASNCQDDRIANQLREMAETHQRKVGDLARYFNQSVH